MDENKEKAFDQSVSLHVAECWNSNENFLNKGPQKLGFILEILIGFCKLLSEVSIGSLLLNTVFPPDLCHLLAIAVACSLLMLYLSKVYHFLIESLNGFPCKRDRC